MSRPPQELSRPRPARPGDRPDDPALTAAAERIGERLGALEARIRERDERTLALQVELTEIPAPPFAEGPRSERVAELLEAAGLLDVERDEEGNVLARLGEGERPLVLSAHMDTVFPGGTDVRVRRRDGRLEAPGISDDGRGLAALVSLAEVLGGRHAPPLPFPVLFVATVGEEGPGGLRGVRHLFRDDGPGRKVRAFVSMDGAGLSRVVTSGLGSIRYRITARGPGGHSWVDWGRPNPIHVLAPLVRALTELDLPEEPVTTLTVGRWGGGTSVNAIPQEAWVEVEVRSTGAEVLEDLKGRIVTMVQGLERSGEPEGPGLAVELRSLGHRPAGATDPAHPLVRAFLAATRSLGVDPRLAVSSTDANIPMSLAIPAVTVGAGGEAGAAHTQEEWYRNTDGPEGLLRALRAVVLFAELEEPDV